MGFPHLQLLIITLLCSTLKPLKPCKKQVLTKWHHNRLPVRDIMKSANTKPPWPRPLRPRLLHVYNRLPSKEIPIGFQDAKRQWTCDVVGAEWWSGFGHVFQHHLIPVGTRDAPDRERRHRTPAQRKSTSVVSDTSINPSASLYNFNTS